MNEKVMIDRDAVTIVKCKSNLHDENGLALFYRNGFYVAYQDEQGDYIVKSHFGEWVNVNEKGFAGEFAFGNLI